MSRLRRLLPLLTLIVALVAFGTWRYLRPPPITIVLISIDTMRPDRLGAYGNTPDVSPNIDALAQGGALFTQVLALAPWTLPSHMTMLTGLDPVAHGVRNADYRLSGKVVTLAEALEDAGFRTGAFTDGGFVASRYGFGQGFEVYRDRMSTEGPNGFRRLLPEALDWMHDTRHENSFVFIHTFDVHTPYDDSDPEIREQFRRRPVKDGPDDWQLNRLKYMYQQNEQRVTEYGRMGELLNDYDAGVHEADRGVGQIVQELKDTGRYDNALIIVTSDHGEAFAERGLHIGHGLALTDDELHVPLVIHLPHGEAAGQRVATQVDLSDIARTVLDFAGVKAPGDMQGESLLGLLRGKARVRTYSMGESQNAPEAFLVMNGYKFITAPSLDYKEVAKRHLGPMTPPAAGADEGLEYQLGHRDPPIVLHYDFIGDPLGIKDTMPQVPQLYDRVKDPKELHNLWEEDQPRAKLMAGMLKTALEASDELHGSLDDGQTPEPIDRVHEQQLSQLGYVELGRGNATDLRIELPKFQREELANPSRAPDVSLLVQADRQAQVLREHLQGGGTMPAGSSRWLEDIGNTYIMWMSQNRELQARVLWRLEALRVLGEQAGLPSLDARWRRRVLELGAHPEIGSPHSSSSHGAPAEPAEPAKPDEPGATPRNDKPQH